MYIKIVWSNGQESKVEVPSDFDAQTFYKDAVDCQTWDRWNMATLKGVFNMAHAREISVEEFLV
jgi:hypothetical protein